MSGRPMRGQSSDRPMSVADIVEAVHKGRIGHADAMRRLHLSSLPELVETVHMHGLSMWGHRPSRLTRSTLDVLKRVQGSHQNGVDAEDAS